MSYSPKTLAMLTALQPKFREVMGPIQFGDRIHYRGKVGPVTDKQVNQGGNGREYIIINAGFGWIEEQYLDFIPSVCDDSSEEAYKRSLWGMVDWTRHWPLISCMGELTIETLDYPRKVICAYGNVTDALLSALCKQWGVEV